MKILLVDDEESEFEICSISANNYTDINGGDEISITQSKSIVEALNKIQLSREFDGMIVDIKLDNEGDEGCRLIQMLADNKVRIPVCVYTATPDNSPRADHIKVLKKGAGKYDKIFSYFRGFYDTGLTRIMGGRGEIESLLYDIFVSKLIFQREEWIEYGRKDPSKTEKVLLRHILSHITQTIDRSEEDYFPEEFYLSPPFTEYVQTGSIVFCDLDLHNSKKFYVVMNPACDLVVRRGGEFKTDRLFLVKIESTKKIIRKTLNSSPSQDKNVDNVRGLLQNKRNLYYHWLPPVSGFCGGFMNFRKIVTISERDYRNNYKPSDYQIAPSFIKDVIFRMSSYYARQGQPDVIHIDNLVKGLIGEAAGS